MDVWYDGDGRDGARPSTACSPAPPSACCPSRTARRSSSGDERGVTGKRVLRRDVEDRLRDTQRRSRTATGRDQHDEYPSVSHLHAG